MDDITSLGSPSEGQLEDVEDSWRRRLAHGFGSGLMNDHSSRDVFNGPPM